MRTWVLEEKFCTGSGCASGHKCQRLASFIPSRRLICKKDKESVQFRIKCTPKANFSTVKWDNCKTQRCTVEITQDKSYRLLFRFGRKDNLKSKPQKKDPGWGVTPLIAMKSRRLSWRRLDLPQHITSVICSVTECLPLAPKNNSKVTAGLQDRQSWISFFLVSWSSFLYGLGYVFFCFYSKNLGGSKDGLVEKLQRLWLDLILPVTDFHVSLQTQHLCWPSRTAAYLGQNFRSRANAVLQELHLLPLFKWYNPAEPQSGHTQGRARSLQRLPVSMQNTKNNQSRPRTGYFSPHTHSKQLQIWDSSLQQVTNPQSSEMGSAGRWAMGLGSSPQHCSSQGFFPLVHAPEYSVGEQEFRVVSMLFTSASVSTFSHQSTSNKHCICCLINTRR